MNIEERGTFNLRFEKRPKVVGDGTVYRRGVAELVGLVTAVSFHDCEKFLRVERDSFFANAATGVSEWNRLPVRRTAWPVDVVELANSVWNCRVHFDDEAVGTLNERRGMTDACSGNQPVGTDSERFHDSNITVHEAAVLYFIAESTDMTVVKRDIVLVDSPPC